MDERGPRDFPTPITADRALEAGLGFYAVTFTDIVRSTDQRATIGDTQADISQADVDALTRRVMEQFRGVVVKSLGDGLLAIFRAPTDAVLAGVEVQRQLARRNRSAAVAVHLRVGVTVGEVDVVNGDVYGYPVNEAARLCAAAQPSSVLVSELAASLARRADVTFADERDVEVTPSAPPTRALSVIVSVEDLTLVPMPDALTYSPRDGAVVGRTSELEDLTTQWRRAVEGDVQLAVITGEAGLGKTTLLGELARTVFPGPGIILYGRCDERVAAPYQPFVEALNHFAESCPQLELEQLLGPAAGQLVNLIPALGRRLEVQSSTPLRDPEFERWRLHEGMATTLRTLSEFEPLLLIIDDLHWAGTSTIDLIDKILRDSARQRLMVILALRPWDPATDPGVDQLLADRHRLLASVRDVDLRGLNRDDVGELAARWKGADTLDEATAGELWNITAGNPLFLEQMLSNASDDQLVSARLPSGVTDVIGRQLDKLTPPTRSLLRVASLIGLRFEAHLVVLATERSRNEVLDCLEEGSRAGVIRPLEGSPARYEFVHALVRATLDDEFSVARRCDVHARIALALEESSGLDSSERLRRMAFHWSEAGEFGDPAKGVTAACSAISNALAHIALSDAFELLTRAESLAELGSDDHQRAELAVLRAEARSLAAQPQARDEQLAAVKVAQAVGDPSLLSRAALAHSRGYFTAWGRRDDDRTNALEAALALCPPDDRSTRALLLSRLANELTFGDVTRRRFDLADDALTLAREHGEPAVLASVFNHRQYVFGAPEHLELRLSEGQEMQQIAVASGDHLLEMHACRLMCAAFTESADVDQLDSTLARLVSLNEEVDLAGSKWELASVRASRAIFAGELKEASSHVRDAFTLGGAAGQTDAFIFAGAQLMHLNYLRGRLPEIIDTFLDAAPDEVKEHLRAWVTRELFYAGRVDQAREWWNETLRVGLETQLGVGVNAGLVLVSWAQLASVFETDELIIAELRQRLEPVANQLFQQLAPEQPGHHYLALLADASGEPESCDDHFSQAALLLERVNAPVMLAITEVAWAQSLDRRGEAQRAHALAAQALIRASRAGATQIEKDANEVLGSVG